MQQHRVAIFASGTGSNAVNIIETFREAGYPVSFRILSNRQNAPVLERARELDVPAFCFTAYELAYTDKVRDYLREEKVDFIVLAGFMLKVPAPIVAAYPQQVINIHPALLPKFGGQGMYGERVHRAVLKAGETESGITIHHVNEEYDQGATIFQASCPVHEGDTPETLARRVQELEHEHYPRVLRRLLKLDESYS